jgi:hypothetical protein
LPENVTAPLVGAAVRVGVEAGRRVGPERRDQVRMRRDVVEGREVAPGHRDGLEAAVEPQLLYRRRLVHPLGRERGAGAGDRRHRAVPGHDLVVGARAAEPQGVEAVAAIDDVVPGPAVGRVVAPAHGEEVVAPVAEEVIAEGRSLQAVVPREDRREALLGLTGGRPVEDLRPRHPDDPVCPIDQLTGVGLSVSPHRAADRQAGRIVDEPRAVELDAVIG